MGYKTPEEMLKIVLEEHLLTDACMTIIDGRNDYGFRAVKIPASCIEQTDDDTKFILNLVDEKGEDVNAEVSVPANGKNTSLWMVSLSEGKYDIVCVQNDAINGDPREIEQKEYLSMIAMFLDHFNVGTKARLYAILKSGYKKLKEETGLDNAYELLRDQMNKEIDIRKTDNMPQKFGVRFNFHALNSSENEKM